MRGSISTRGIVQSGQNLQKTFCTAVDHRYFGSL